MFLILARDLLSGLVPDFYLFKHMSKVLVRDCFDVFLYAQTLILVNLIVVKFFVWFTLVEMPPSVLDHLWTQYSSIFIKLLRTSNEGQKLGFEI